jgi:hypothetical protein
MFYGNCYTLEQTNTDINSKQLINNTLNKKMTELHNSILSF